VITIRDKKRVQRSDAATPDDERLAELPKTADAAAADEPPAASEDPRIHHRHSQEAQGGAPGDRGTVSDRHRAEAGSGETSARPAARHAGGAQATRRCGSGAVPRSGAPGQPVMAA